METRKKIQDVFLAIAFVFGSILGHWNNNIPLWGFACVYKLPVNSDDSWKLFFNIFENRSFRRILRWRKRKESSHVTCYKACRPFEMCIICLAFLLIQKVDVSVITVKSTSRELNGRRFSSCPSKFLFPCFIKAPVFYNKDVIDLAQFSVNIKLKCT